MGSSKERFIPLSYQFRKDQQRVMNNPLLWQSGVDVYKRTDCFLLQEADGNGDGWATSVQQGCEHQASLDSVDEVHPSVRTAQGFYKLTSINHVGCEWCKSFNSVWVQLGNEPSTAERCIHVNCDGLTFISGNSRPKKCWSGEENFQLITVIFAFFSPVSSDYCS